MENVSTLSELGELRGESEGLFRETIRHRQS